MRPKGDKKWKHVNKDETVLDLTYTIPRLTEGKEYEFRVIAENKVGPGEPSAPCKPVKYGN